MKHLYILALCLLFPLALTAQDNFYYSQYFQVGPAINPGFTGIDNFTDIKINYRSQWNGFSDAPRTNYFGVNSYIKKESDQIYREYALRISDPSILDSLSSTRSFFKDKMRHGIGGYIIFDQQGPFEQISGFFNYAFHFPISFKTSVSIGASVGLTNNRMDLEKINLRDPDNDDYYQQLIAQGGRNTYLDIIPGVVVYNEKWYASYSASRLLRTSISSDEVLNYDQTIVHNVMAGLRVNIREKTKFLPSVYYSTQDVEDLWEVNTKFMFKEKTWVGASYRSTETLVFMAGLYINNLVNISYSYDYLLSNLNNYTNGSHEIHLGLMLKKKDLKSPYLW